MKVASGVEMLDVKMNFLGELRSIHPTLLFDEEAAVLIDVGMPGQLEDIKQAMAAVGVPFDRLKAVILTHQDIDHIGAIEQVLAAKAVPVYAHAEDKPYIQGEKEPIKMNRDRVEQMLANAPEEVRTQMKAMFGHPPKAAVTYTVEDGEVLPFFGGVTVVFTPGHTPGHISLYHNATKTVIAGDSTVSQDGRLLGPAERATPDMPLALASLKKFTAYDIDRVICYHGGLCNEQVNEQFRALVK